MSLIPGSASLSTAWRGPDCTRCWQGSVHSVMFQSLQRGSQKIPVHPRHARRFEIIAMAVGNAWSHDRLTTCPVLHGIYSIDACCLQRAPFPSNVATGSLALTSVHWVQSRKGPLLCFVESVALTAFRSRPSFLVAVVDIGQISQSLIAGNARAI